jgi:hypothetical protein
MRKYRVRLQGFDPAAGFDNDGPKCGFWTTRFLEAESEEEAGRRAVSLVLADDHLAEVVRVEWLGQPVVRAEGVDEVTSFASPGQGYTFFGGKYTAG